MAIEVPSSYTVQGALITTDATRWTYGTVTRALDQYAYYDFGAAFFSGRAYIESTIYVSATAGGGNKSLNTTFTNYVDDWSGYSGGEAGGQLFGNSANAQAWYSWVYDFVNLGATGVSLTLGTIYYTRAGFLSSLGQYGGVFVQVFSDSSRTTHVGTFFTLRTAATDYRYLMVGQNYQITSNTNSITGYEENLTIYQPDAGEDLTSFTETDVGSDLIVVADCIVADTMASNITSKVMKDGGAGYYANNYVLTGALNISAMSSGSTGFGILGLGNTTSETIGATSDKHVAEVYYNAATNCRIQLVELSGTTKYTSASYVSYTYTDGPKWAKLRRDTTVGTYGTIYLQLYNDIALQSPYGSEISLALHEDIDFQYFYALMSRSTGGTGTSTFTIGGVSATVGVSSASITSVGGAVAGGSSTVKIGQKVLSSGGGVLGGSSPILISNKIVSAGGGVLGGTALQYGTLAGTSSASITGSGGMVAGGSSIIKIGLKVSSSGGAVIGGSAGISVAYAPSLSEYIYTETVTDSSGNPITGVASQTSIFLKNLESGYIMDWSDVTMKASGWGSTTDVLNEAVYPAGEYGYDVPLGGLTNGRYCATLKYTPTTPTSSDPIQTFQVEFYVVGGYIVDQYTATTVAALPSSSDNATAVLAAASTTPIAADVQQVRSGALKGDGSKANPWNPA